MLAIALAAASIGLGACGGDGGGDGSDGGGDGGGAQPAVFPEGGSGPDERVTNLRRAAAAAGCVLEDTPARGEGDRAHTQDPVEYRGNPPTLGAHAPAPAGDGLYQEAPPDEYLVHTMEHGRVIVWAKPDLPREARATLRALFEEDSYQMVLTPRANMPYAVAATAWNAEPRPAGAGRTLGCEEWSPEVVDAIRAFRDEHRGRGPEPIP